MWSVFRKQAPSDSVAIPKDSAVILQGESEGFPELRVINQALDGFAGAAAFPWHLSLIIDMVEKHDVGLPTSAETEVLKAFAKELRNHLEADANAAFLASVTWNGTRQLVFRVRDPEVANTYLTRVTADPSPTRQFDYRMEKDAAWALAEQYLEPGRAAMKAKRA